MRIPGIILMVLGAAAACDAAPASPVDGGPGRNLFRELLGKSDAETDARIAGAWKQLFYGADDAQRLFYPVAGGMAYVPDVANNDVRTEGLSYAMMICVQLDHQAEFNQIWKWAKTYLYHQTGPLRGYFAWHGDFQGRQMNPGPAPDGEEWFTMALFFASHRWGNGDGIYDYGTQAQGILHAMLHKDEDPERGGTADMFDRAAKQIVFAPDGPGALFTDPSYHLPFFYELWARWASEARDRAFCAEAARASRALFKLAADPRTGLMPDYCEFDGRPHARHGHEDFLYDAWRTLSYPALDYAWFNPDPWVVERSNRVLRFLEAQGPSCPDRFKLDGTPVSTTYNSPGLIAMAAVAGLAADPDVARPFVAQLWGAETPSGRYRYYNGLLYMLALLEAGGRFRAFPPASAP
jgi:oligosaccharide reducing-end xylanase